ncbi:protein kinase [Kribbella sp. NPDC049227]|uniref:protein kinase domain-containing protein n=1 Tax=Kribbella sp. NPDC049227 TaxID=3364113 RepID=UPI003717A451
MDLDDIAGYSLRRKLGSGSAGSVWQVRDLASGRNAVLKRVPVSAISDLEELREQLFILQRVSHPHLARLLELRETESEWLLFGQYVAAGTLTSLLGRRGALSTGELVTLLSPLAEALDHLHRSGLTHGRVTAPNVMFDSAGRPVLTDPVIHPHLNPGAKSPAPTDDLTALTHLAHQSGGSPALFPPTLFTTGGTRDLLALDAPAPIDLAFPEPENGPDTTKPSTDDDDPVQRSRGPLTPSPPDESATDSVQPTRPQVTPPKPLPRLPKPSRRPTSRRPRLSRRTAAAPTNPLDRLTPRQPASELPAPPPSTPTTNSSGLPPPGRRRLRRRVWRRRHTFWRRRFPHPAYGVLAAAGLGAAVMLVVGLLTVGALDNQPTPTAATDPATPSPQQTPTPAPSQTSAPAPSRTSTASPQPSTPSSPPRPAETADWVRTLQALDAQRAQAFWALQPSLLDKIYVPGSKPWTSDRALIVAYSKQQLRVRGLRIRIDYTTVERRTTTSVTLRTVDHLIAGSLVDRHGTSTPLPPAMPTTRLITLTTNPSTPAWRIATITNI